MIRASFSAQFWSSMTSESTLGRLEISSIYVLAIFLNFPEFTFSIVLTSFEVTFLIPMNSRWISWTVSVNARGLATDLVTGRIKMIGGVVPRLSDRWAVSQMSLPKLATHRSLGWRRAYVEFVEANSLSKSSRNISLPILGDGIQIHQIFISKRECIAKQETS